MAHSKHKTPSGKQEDEADGDGVQDGWSGQGAKDGSVS